LKSLSELVNLSATAVSWTERRFTTEAQRHRGFGVSAAVLLAIAGKNQLSNPGAESLPSLCLCASVVVLYGKILGLSAGAELYGGIILYAIRRVALNLQHKGYRHNKGRSGSFSGC
jgi:hypothetical protein